MKNPLRAMLPLALCTSAAAAATLSPATAAGKPRQQRPVPLPGTGAAAPGPDTLDRALDLVRRGENQKPVLVVDAASVRPAPEAGPQGRQVAAPPPLLRPRSGGGGLPLRDVAAFFDRKVMSAGSLSVLAPATMVVLNTRPGKGDVYAGLQPGDKLRMLLATFSPAQWRRLGGADGLGAGDLSTPEQRDLFASYLPDPFVVQKVAVVAGPDGRPRSQSDGRPVALTPVQRASVRLSLSRRAHLYVPLPNQPGSFHSWETRPDRPVGTQYLVLSDAAARFRQPNDAFGETLRRDVPSAAKPGHLGFDAARLDPLVTLGRSASSQDSPLTVGDLVKRAGAACRLSLFADARVARLPVRVLGGSRGGEGDATLRSGDVLRALCLAVSGTFRKVTAQNESVYVLTDDLEGIGARQARIVAWAGALEQQVWAMSEAARAKVAAQNPAQYLGFAAGDPFALPADLLAKTRQGDDPNRRNRVPGTPLSLVDLPAAYQQFIKESADRQDGGIAGVSPAPVFRPGEVGVNLRTQIAYLLPGTGRIESSGSETRGAFLTGVDGLWEPFSPPLPAPNENEQAAVPIRLPLFPAGAVAGRPVAAALLVRLVTPAEAGQVITEAAKRGFNQVWVTSPDDVQQATLEAALAAGEAARIGVAAVVPLLRRPTIAAAANTADADEATERLDRDIQGRTAAGRDEAWRRIDTVSARAAITQQLISLAATPGLAGLVLEDTGAPGYTDPATEDENNRFNIVLGAFGYGFTPEMRLRFVRGQSTDPVDLTAAEGTAGGVSLALPFFRDARPEDNWGTGRTPVRVSNNLPTPAHVWTALRYQMNTAFLRDLRAALQKSAPTVPLLLAERDFSGPQWYSAWERPDAGPPRYTFTAAPGGYDEGGLAWPFNQAKRFSSRNLRRIAPPPGQKTLDPAMGAWVSDIAKEWNGVVFDLRALSADELTGLLGAAFTPAR